MRGGRRQEQERRSPEQARQSRQASVGGPTSTTTNASPDGNGDEGLTFSQSMHAITLAIETHTDAEKEYFTSFINAIREEKRRNLETIERLEKKAASVDDSYLKEMQKPLAAALEMDEDNGSRKQNPSDAGTARAADDTKPWKAASANVLDSSKRLLRDYDELSRNMKRSDMPSGRLGQSWANDVEELKRVMDIGYKKAQREIADVIGGSKEADDDDREAKAYFPDRERQKTPAGLWRTLDDGVAGVRRITRTLPEPGAEFGSG